MIFPTFKSDKLNWNINVIIWLQFANESPFLWNIRLNLFFCMNHSYWSWLEQEPGSVPDCYMDTGAGVGVWLGCGYPIWKNFLGHAKQHLERQGGRDNEDVALY